MNGKEWRMVEREKTGVERQRVSEVFFWCEVKRRVRVERERPGKERVKVCDSAIDSRTAETHETRSERMGEEVSVCVERVVVVEGVGADVEEGVDGETCFDRDGCDGA